MTADHSGITRGLWIITVFFSGLFVGFGLAVQAFTGGTESYAATWRPLIIVVTVAAVGSITFGLLMRTGLSWLDKKIDSIGR